MALPDEPTRTELEAAAFRRLVEHLRARTDVQNIDLMNLAGFCRNCLSNWYREAAEARGIRHLQGREPRDRLRHALRGVAREVPERGAGGERAAFEQNRPSPRLSEECEDKPPPVLTSRAPAGTPGGR